MAEHIRTIIRDDFRLDLWDTGRLDEYGKSVARLSAVWNWRMTMLELLADLRDDGDSIDLGDGRQLRLKVQPDEGYDPFTDTDCYGQIGCGSRDNDYGRERRPKGFTGNAERISIDRGDMVWWEPPADVKRTDPGFGKLRSLVVDLASWGASYVTLELLEGEDAYSRPIVVDVAGLGGIDSLADGYLLEVIGELAAELAPMA